MFFGYMYRITVMQIEQGLQRGDAVMIAENIIYFVITAVGQAA
jgi:hypothetical protein